MGTLEPKWGERMSTHNRDAPAMAVLWMKRKPEAQVGPLKRFGLDLTVEEGTQSQQ